MKTRKLAAALAFVGLVAAAADAKERPVKREDLPAAVRAAVERERGADGRIRGLDVETEDGRTTYEAELTVAGKHEDFSFDETGKVVAVETVVSLKEVPGPVRAAIEKAAGKGKVLTVESIGDGRSVTAYEAQLRTGGRKSEIRVDPEGKPFADAARGRTYALSRSLDAGGEGGWDYVTVDSERGLLFLPRTTHTMVLEAATGKVVADIPGQTRNHGVALVPSLGRGFITDGEDASVTVFALKDYRVLGKIHAADDADGIVYDPASNKLLVACGDAGRLIPIAADVDPVSGKSDAPVELGGKPEFLAVDGKGRAFVDLVDKNEVAVVDTRAMKVVARWPTAPGGAPTGMAIDPEKGRLFVGCREPRKLIVMDAGDGKILASLPIGAGVDASGFDGGYAFASCRDGSLTVAREAEPGKFQVVQTIKTQAGSRTMGIDARTHALYLPAAEFEPGKEGQHRPSMKPGTFKVLVFALGS